MGSQIDDSAAIRRSGILARLASPQAGASTWLASGLALAAVVVAIATQVALRSGAYPPPVSLGFIVAGSLLASSAFIHTRSPRAHAVSAPDAAAQAWQLPLRWEIAALAGVIALAAFFRFFRFMDFPPGLWYDEAVNGADAITIIDHDHLTVWRESNFGHSTIFFYLLIVAFKIFGFNVFAMRIVPATAGLAAVVAFYFLARWLLGPVPALVAAALLAVSRFAVTFSRISWEASLQPVLEIIAVFFLVRAIETRRGILFALAGASLAAGFYTYLAFRFVPVVMLFLLLYVATAERRLIRTNARGLVVYAVSFVLVVTPVAQYAVQNPDQFLARTRDVSVFKDIDRDDSYDPLWHNVKATVKMMNVAGDKNGRHNLPGAPLLDDVSAALLVLGLAVALWSARDWRRGVIAGWLALSLIPGAFTLSLENPSAIRAIGAIPPLFLLTGIAAAAVYRPMSSTPAGRIVFALFAGGIVLATSALNYRDFFDRQAHDEFVYDSFIPLYTRVGEVVADESEHNSVYVSRELADDPAVFVLTRGRPFMIFRAARDLTFEDQSRDVTMILADRELETVPTLQNLYPRTRIDEDIDPYGRRNFTVVRIPAADITALHTLPVRVYGGPGPLPGPPCPPMRLSVVSNTRAGAVSQSVSGMMSSVCTL